LISTIEPLDENVPLKTQIHRYIFLAGLIGICVGMPLSNGINSLAQALLAINWVVEGNYISKFKSFIRNKPAMVLCSFYIMHLLGLLHTTNFSYGMEDINKKLPLLLFPLVLSTTRPLLEKEKRMVIIIFMLAVTCATFIGGYLLITHQLIDIHDISPFIAPVRLGMMMVLSIFLLRHYVVTNKFSIWSLIGGIWMGWLLFFLLVMQSLTAVIMVVVICLALLLYAAVKAIQNKKIGFGIFVIGVFILGLLSSTGYVVYCYHQYFPKPDIIDMTKLDRQTANGNAYFGGNWGNNIENGHYVIQYINWKELKSGWNKRSKIPYDSADLKGNPLKYTLLRYMTSMGLRKDSVGIWALSQKDINAVELGIPNYHFNSLTSMNYRLYEVFWEIKSYEQGGDINGHSVTMRLEYWRIALILIGRHPIIGCGTGDVRKGFDDYYDATHSLLKPEWRLRSHNQYLEIAVGFGIIGLAWFILSIFYPGIKTQKIYTYFYFIFWMIFMLSLFTEDTLETEAGSTFYAFFNSFFLFL
jgi:O-Antigen ligase